MEEQNTTLNVFFFL